jgi:ATP-dependent Clp protease ATP-binding subunit ClpC
MIERYTESGRNAVLGAMKEARELKHGQVGTEHLLLGVLKQHNSHAAKTLESHGLTLERVRAQVVRINGQGSEEAPSGQLPFTPRAKLMLTKVEHEAQKRGDQYVRPEHILLTLVYAYEGIAARILLDFDLDSELIATELINKLDAEKITEQKQLSKIYYRKDGQLISVDADPDWAVQVFVPEGFIPTSAHAQLDGRKGLSIGKWPARPTT